MLDKFMITGSTYHCPSDITSLPSNEYIEASLFMKAPLPLMISFQDWNRTSFCNKMKHSAIEQHMALLRLNVLTLSAPSNVWWPLPLKSHHLVCVLLFSFWIWPDLTSPVATICLFSLIKSNVLIVFCSSYIPLWTYAMKHNNSNNNNNGSISYE